jgi:disulfide bond formation protein DsbB
MNTTDFRLKLASFSILSICFVLTGAFVVQFSGEYPCPLCILQRMAMMLCALGPAWLLLRARTGPVDAKDYGTCYGLSIFSALLGASFSTRQILLHIAPGDPGYGSAVFGMHLYTWALIVFLFVIIVSATQLFFLPAIPERLENKPLATFSIWALGVLILANAIAVLALEGFHWFLPDNPDAYLLFK